MTQQPHSMTYLPSRITRPIKNDLMLLNISDSALFIGRRVTVGELSEGVDSGEINMLCRVASLYIRGVLLPKKITFAIVMLEELSRADSDASKCKSLNVRYVLGQAYNVVGAYDKAYKVFYELAHERNHGLSHIMLSGYYKYGIFVKKSPELRENHLNLGAETGDTQSKHLYAKYLLGNDDIFSRFIGFFKIVMNYPRLVSAVFDESYSGREFIGNMKVSLV